MTVRTAIYSFSLSMYVVFYIALAAAIRPPTSIAAPTPQRIVEVADDAALTEERIIRTTTVLGSTKSQRHPYLVSYEFEGMTIVSERPPAIAQ